MKKKTLDQSRILSLAVTATETVSLMLQYLRNRQHLIISSSDVKVSMKLEERKPQAWAITLQGSHCLRQKGTGNVLGTPGKEKMEKGTENPGIRLAEDPRRKSRWSVIR
ncbi:hypothetical protein P7K49_013367 [Saguinus oedipus]|uniref:Uncharacterized protein n=1 Tax=Saguinus oedipus TaxID=9490 RepID=A0ABQ9VIM3_SAGOE|nr:hypothetical protein P7K49_013367 [Saguinus oedipus]